jgi:hypothetical protein
MKSHSATNTDYSVVDAKTLEPRSMSVSHDRVAIPLGTDPDLRLQYINWMGFVRFGMILEDLDTFAGWRPLYALLQLCVSVWLCYKHNQGGSDMGRPAHHPMAIVTACVDRSGSQFMSLLHSY